MGLCDLRPRADRKAATKAILDWRKNPGMPRPRYCVPAWLKAPRIFGIRLGGEWRAVCEKFLR